MSVLGLSWNVASWRRVTPQSPDSLPGTGPSGRLWDPSRAGRPLDPVVAADNDAAIQAIEKQLHCTCGCNLDVYTWGDPGSFLVDDGAVNYSLMEEEWLLGDALGTALRSQMTGEMNGPDPGDPGPPE